MSDHDRMSLFRRVTRAALGRHPSAAALERYHAGAARPGADARIASHAASCAPCRDWLRWRAALGAAARDLAHMPAAEGARDAVLAGALRRPLTGERFLVPAERSPRFSATGALPRADAVPRTSTHRGPSRSTRTLAGIVAASVLLAAAFLARPARVAGAGTVAGDLTLAPSAPRFGDTLTVRYRPGARLADTPRLRLRATYHPDDDTRPWARPAVTAAWLMPGPNGEYRGRVVLPAGVAYARFAVEDSAGHVVDSHGRQPWDVIVADAAGRPRVAGIRSQAMASDRSEWERTRAIALEATRLHPEHPSGWWVRTEQDAELVGSARTDSIAAAARPVVARLDTALDRAATRESWAMLDLASFAEFAGLSAVRDRWRARLLREAPRSIAAYSLRVMTLWGAKASPVMQLDSLERWWAADGDSLSLFLSQGVGIAMTAHDTAAARRWAARAVGTAPVASVFVAQQLVRDPALAVAGVAYARADIARLAAGDAERPLGATAAEWARERAERARAALAVVGEGLLALGRPREAITALARATAEGWNADAFRLLGEARLVSGDTAGALGAFAYAVADPILGHHLGGPLGARLGGRVRDAAWARSVADARRAMHDRVLRATVAEPLPGDPRLGDAARGRRRLSDVAAGRVALVAMLNSHCGPVLADLPAIAQLRAGLDGRPVAFVAVTREAPDEAVERTLRARGLTTPLWYDLDGEATTMLDARGTPTYLVLDPTGTVRWRGHRVRDASPVLDALLAPRAGTAPVTGR